MALSLQDTRIACGFETGNTSWEIKDFYFLSNLPIVQVGFSAFSSEGQSCLFEKMIIVRGNGFSMILNESLCCLDSERFLWRWELCVQISMTTREDRAEKKPFLQAEELMDCQRQELIAF